MQARRPVKATVLLSAELSNSVTVITPIVAPQERLTYRVAFFLAGRRARVLGAGAFFCSASILARSASIRFTTRGGGVSRAGSIFSPACFFFKRSMRAENGQPTEAAECRFGDRRGRLAGRHGARL